MPTPVGVFTFHALHPLDDKVGSYVVLALARLAYPLSQSNQYIDFVIGDLCDKGNFLGCELLLLKNSCFLKPLQFRLRI
jgi:hypothetical protein